MTDKTDNQLTEQLTDPYGVCLHAIARSAICLQKVSEILTELACKRVTLEEKMIRRHFHELSIVLGSVVQRLHSLARQGDEIADKCLLDELLALLADIEKQLDELLKIVHYNLNFLEQYFEHGFVEKLLNEYCFPQRLQAILDKLPATDQTV